MFDSTQIQWNTTAEEIVKIYQTDLTNKVAIVTGSNSGIGLETARVLALVGAKVIIPCRTIEKSNGAIEHIKKTVPNADLIPMQLDLSDLSSIKKFANDFLELDLPLHILVNNAGIMSCPLSYTKDGFEMQFGVNHLGHFYLTKLLKDILKSSAPSRVINVTSSGNIFLSSEKGIDFDNLNGEKGYNSWKAYGQSKLANILHAKELQRQFEQEGADVTVTSVHPGAVESNLDRHLNFTLYFSMLCQVRKYKLAWKEATQHKNSKFPKSVQIGSSSNIYCAVSSDIVKGGFYFENAINTEFLNEQANNVEMAKQLWDVSERLVSSKIN